MEKAYLLLSDAEIKGNVVLIDHSDDRMIKNDVRIEQSKVKQSKKNTNVFFRLQTANRLQRRRES